MLLPDVGFSRHLILGSATWSLNMTDRSLAALLIELDGELAKKNDPDQAAADILSQVEARVPGAIMRSAATLQLRSLRLSPHRGQ